MTNLFFYLTKIMSIDKLSEETIYLKSWFLISKATSGKFPLSRKWDVNFLDQAMFWYRKYQLQMTQLTFICSKSTIETLEKDVKYVQN